MSIPLQKFNNIKSWLMIVLNYIATTAFFISYNMPNYWPSNLLVNDLKKYYMYTYARVIKFFRQ